MCTTENSTLDLIILRACFIHIQQVNALKQYFNSQYDVIFSPLFFPGEWGVELRGEIRLGVGNS